MSPAPSRAAALDELGVSHRRLPDGDLVGGDRGALADPLVDSVRLTVPGGIEASKALGVEQCQASRFAQDGHPSCPRAAAGRRDRASQAIEHVLDGLRI